MTPPLKAKVRQPHAPVSSISHDRNMSINAEAGVRYSMACGGEHRRLLLERSANPSRCPRGSPLPRPPSLPQLNWSRLDLCLRWSNAMSTRVRGNVWLLESAQFPSIGLGSPWDLLPCGMQFR